ncbi:MAG: endonuclease domain-containing protein [Janthinobacterium lividum]
MPAPVIKNGRVLPLLPLPPGEGRGEGSGKNRTETKKARALRRSATPAEVKLWLALRNGTLHGTKFRRQFPCGLYILDLAAAGVRLAVEIDGESHFTGHSPARDSERDAWLKAQGWQVLRFTNPEVLRNLEGVLETIGTALRGLPHPNPLPKGEGAA